MLTELTNIGKLLKVYTDQIQEIENLIYQIPAQIWLNNATNNQLDGLGEIIGELRNYRSDDDYRTALKFRVILNFKNGEPETLIQALKFATGSQNIHYQESYPAKVFMTFANDSIPNGLPALMQDIAPTGVQLTIISNLGADGFVMDNIDQTLPDSQGLGMSSTDQIEGGQFSTIAFIS